MEEHLLKVREYWKKVSPRYGGAQWMYDVGAAFGKEAQRWVSVVADKITAEQMARNKSAFGRMPGVEKQWHKYTNDVFYQWNAFKTNLQNLGTVTFLPGLPRITTFLNDLNAHLRRLVSFLHANPDLANKVAAAIAAVTAALGVRAICGALVLFRAALDLTTAKITADAAIIRAGAVGGTVVGGAGILGWVDRFLLAGLGAAIIRNGARFTSSVGSKVILPMLEWVNTLGPLGARVAAFVLRFGVGVGAFAASASSLESIVARLGPALAGLTGPLGAIIQALGMVLTYRTPANELETKRLGGQTHAYWDKYAKLHGWRSVPKDVLYQLAPHDGGAQRYVSQQVAGSVRLNLGGVTININESKTPKETGQAVVRALTHPAVVLSRGGAYKTDWRTPLPASVGAAAFNH